ncbi:MAG TPA: serine/threonine-protein kinase [Longimicrobiales bacterium]|nr:serine/threonine-protein kinase [Longimicrobiales bacterium]
MAEPGTDQGMTDREREPGWDRVQEIFLEALETAPTHRRALLDRACGGDDRLRAEVESLLEAQDEGPLAELPDERRWQGRIPDRIGEYRIVRPLGSGGMGRVFLAVREKDGFAQTVALKLLSSGFAHTMLETRLREERRILARLEHPNIARFIDGGLTPDRQPFMAVEYVQGQDLLDYCAVHRLDVHKRLELFLAVCDAIHHAHQQLVIHRDLKPTNIMVTSDGRPKLLDFGVAKVLDEEQAEGTRSAAWLTPAYASPEQLRGDSVTTLSDVYGLGLVLYELLTGTRPYRAAGRSPAEMEREITTVGPVRPSVRVTQDADERLPGPEERAALLGTSVGRLRRLLAGDLDVIVLRALAQTPERRYTSAAALAEDIRLHLEGRPVHARPDSVAYRLSRLLRRHKVAATVGLVASLAALAGVAGAVWQASRARHEAESARVEAQRARQVAGLVGDLFRLSDPVRAGGDTVTVLRLVVEGAGRIEQELADDAAMQATLLSEIIDVYRNLGLLDRAEGVARRVVDLRRGSGQRGIEWVGALGDLGDVLAALGRTDEAAALYREALAAPAATPADTVAARVRARLGWELRARGDAEEAAQLFQAALSTFEAAGGASSPGAADARMGLAATFHDTGRFDEAEDIFRTAIPDDPSRARADPAVAEALANLGMLRRLRGNYREAELLSEAALDMRRRLYGDDHLETLTSVADWGAELIELGRWTEARAVLADGVERARSALGVDHPTTADLEESLANVLGGLGEYEDALALQSRVLDAKRVRRGEEHPGVAYSLVRLGAMARDAGLAGRAQSAFAIALETSQKLSGTRSVYGALALQGLGMWNADLGRLEEAEDHLVRTRAQLEGELRPEHRYLGHVDRDLALVRTRAGRPEGAAALASDVLRRQEAARPFPHPELGRTLLVVGEALLAEGDANGARAAFARAGDAFVTLPAGHWLRGMARVGLGAAERRAGAPGAEAKISGGLDSMRRHLGAAAPAVRWAERLAGAR